MQQAVAHAPKNTSDEAILDRLEELLAARRTQPPTTTPPRRGRWRKDAANQSTATGQHSPDTGSNQPAPTRRWKVDERRFPGKQFSGATQVLNALREGRAPDGDVVVLNAVQKQEAVELAQVHGVQKNMTVIVSDTPDNDQTTAANGDDTSQWVAVVKGGRPSMKKLECTNLQGAKIDAPKHEVEGPEPPAVRATTTVRVTMVKEFMTDAQWKTARQRPGA
eukprot:3973606-Pyramimonas_sp.AAC.2